MKENDAREEKDQRKWNSFNFSSIATLDTNIYCFIQFKTQLLEAYLYLWDQTAFLWHRISYILY